IPRPRPANRPRPGAGDPRGRGTGRPDYGRRPLDVRSADGPRAGASVRARRGRLARGAPGPGGPARLRGSGPRARPADRHRRGRADPRAVPRHSGARGRRHPPARRGPGRRLDRVAPDRRARRELRRSDCSPPRRWRGPADRRRPPLRRGDPELPDPRIPGPDARDAGRPRRPAARARRWLLARARGTGAGHRRPPGRGREVRELGRESLTRREDTMKIEMFHLMPYRDLPEDFRERYRSVWVDVPSELCDPIKSHEYYNQSLDELEYGAAMG